MLWLIHVPDPPRFVAGLATGSWYALASELGARLDLELPAPPWPLRYAGPLLPERILPDWARVA